MTLKEIRDKCRKILDDEVGSNSTSYWMDSDLNEYINASIEELCERTLCITDSLTDHDTATVPNNVCLIPLVAGQKHYALHGSILDVQTVQPSWTTLPLAKQSMATAGTSWLVAVGLPTAYLMDYSSGMLSLLSAPATVTTESIRLTVNRLPITELSANTDTSEIPRQYHRKLSSGVLSQAFSKQDSEIYKPEKANKHKKEWEEFLLDVVRRESRLKPRFTIARRVELS